MSNKSSRPGKKVALPPTQSTPRSMEDILKAEAQLVADAGRNQYAITVYEEQLSQINNALRNLNYEAGARKELDAKNSPPTSPTENTGV